MLHEQGDDVEAQYAHGKGEVSWRSNERHKKELIKHLTDGLSQIWSYAPQVFQYSCRFTRN